MHYAFGSLGFGWVSFVGIGSESVFRLEPVHVDVAVFFEFGIEFLAQFLMMLFREVSEGICNGLTLLFF